MKAPTDTRPAEVQRASVMRLIAFLAGTDDPVPRAAIREAHEKGASVGDIASAAKLTLDEVRAITERRPDYLAEVAKAAHRANEAEATFDQAVVDAVLAGIPRREIAEATKGRANKDTVGRIALVAMMPRRAQ